MQTKYKLPKDIYQTTLWIIRGQERRENDYRKIKDDILNGGGLKYIKNHSQAIASHNATEIKALALVALENNSETIKIKIIQQALDEACDSFKSNEEKEYFKKAVMLNITDRRKYPFRNLFVVGISEKTFYNYKAKFIYLVANKINLI